MMELKFTLSQTAAAMGMEPAQMGLLLSQCGIRPQEDGLTLEQIQRLHQAAQARQEENRLRAQSSLERLIQRCTPLIDTCSLLHPQFPLLAERMAPLLRQNCRVLIVPSGVMAELRTLPLKKPELAERIQAVLPLLSQLHQQGLVRVYGGEEERFGDQHLLTAATRLLTSSPLLVITQDCGLSGDLLRLNQMDSMRERYTVAVSRVNRYGFLSRFQPLEQRTSAPAARPDETAPAASIRGKADVGAARTGASGAAPAEAERGQESTGSWRLLWNSFTRSIREELAAQRAEDRAPAEESASRPEGQPSAPERRTTAASAQVYQQLQCVECGQTFDITEGEFLYYREHNLVLPRRCPACRRARRMARAGLAFGA